MSIRKHQRPSYWKQPASMNVSLTEDLIAGLCLVVFIAVCIAIAAGIDPTLTR